MIKFIRNYLFFFFLVTMSKTNKIELLSPAGNMECLKAAIAAGCDAVYLGGRAFGARAFSKNFSDNPTYFN